LLNELGIDLICEVDDNPDGEDGPVKEWGLWYKQPTADDIEKALIEYNTQNSNANLMVSPKRKQLHQDAFNSMKRAATKMKTRAQKISGDIKLDDVVYI